MSKKETKEIRSAIERTIDETQQEIERQRKNGQFNPTTIMNMGEYRRGLESYLDYYILTHRLLFQIILQTVTGLDVQVAIHNLLILLF